MKIFIYFIFIRPKRPNFAIQTNQKEVKPPSAELGSYYTSRSITSPNLHDNKIWRLFLRIMPRNIQVAMFDFVIIYF